MATKQIQDLIEQVREIREVTFNVDEMRSRMELGRHSGPVQRPRFAELLSFLGDCWLDLQKIEQAFDELLATLDLSAEMSTKEKEDSDHER